MIRWYIAIILIKRSLVSFYKMLMRQFAAVKTQCILNSNIQYFPVLYHLFHSFVYSCSSQKYRSERKGYNVDCIIHAHQLHDKWNDRISPYSIAQKIYRCFTSAIDSISWKSTFFCRKTQTHFKTATKSLSRNITIQTSCEDYFALILFVCLWSFTFFNVNCIINPWEKWV